MRSKSKKIDKAWLHDHINDPWVKLAQREGYRSRAAYKLIEIDQQFKLLRPYASVCDLGSAPGAWSQYLRKRLHTLDAAARSHAVPSAATSAHTISRCSRIFALDLLPMEHIEDVQFLQGDFREHDVLQALEALMHSAKVDKIDCIVCDMAPNLSGIADVDAARMSDVVELALEFALQHLHPSGSLVSKVFHGSGYSQLVERYRTVFQTVRPFKPQASRPRSAETFLIGQRLKGAGRRG